MTCEFRVRGTGLECGSLANTADGEGHDGDTRREQRDRSSHLRGGHEPGDIDFLDQVFTQDYTAHFPGKPPIVGLKECKKAIAIFLAAFPDAVYVIEDLIAEGDRVVARWSAKGTHKGPFQGIPAEHMVPPTGRPVSFGATDIYRMVDGKVAEEWNTIEQLDLMVQIGALKLP